MTRPGRRLVRHAGDAGGYVVAEWVMVTALVVVPITLLVLSLPTWAERQALARKAANESARAYVLAATDAEGEAAAEEVVAQIRANYGLTPAQLSVGFDGTLERGADITATATVELPALDIPLLGSAGRWTWDATHVEHVDDYRSF